MTKIIRAQNVQIVCHKKPKPWSYISLPRSEFFVLALQS